MEAFDLACVVFCQGHFPLLSMVCVCVSHVGKFISNFEVTQRWLSLYLELYLKHH